MTTTSARPRYLRDVHYEVFDGISVVRLGKRNTLAIVVFHFTSERDARAFARGRRASIFRVDRQRRTELKVRRARP